MKNYQVPVDKFLKSGRGAMVRNAGTPRPPLTKLVPWKPSKHRKGKKP